MKTETLAYRADLAMVSTLYLPDAPKAVPGVLVFPDIFGLGDHAHERAARLAELGYAALAVDLHGEQRILEVEAVMPELERLYADPERPCARGAASLKALADHPAVDGTRIAAIGFCYGGTLALEMARRGQALAAVVGFHSSLATTYPSGASAIKGEVLVCLGSEDPSIPAEQRAAFESEMRAVGAKWQVHLYGGVYHTFTDYRCDALNVPDFARYSASADQRSWKAMHELLQEVFGRYG
ncbi:MAG TPA: dienelactone hydrolase family protein [Novosphingobium sp.]|nr:dienelactone hydrolase family protein [Novosphingobium sp.]